MVKTRNNGESWRGTSGERLLNLPNPEYEGQVFYETDTLRNYIGSGSVWVLYSLASNVMIWRGKWVDGTFAKSEVTRDGSWTMIANKITSDRAAPQPFGEESFLLPEVPVWTPQSSVNAVWSGLRISNLTNSYLVNSIRVWLPNISASVDYRILLEDNITGLITVGQVFSGDILTVIGWFTTHIEPSWLLPLDDVTIWLLAENVASTTAYNHPWLYAGSSNQNNDPGLGNLTNRGQQTVLRINTTDDDAVDRSAELGQAITGTIIRVANEADLTRYYEYEVLTQTDNGSWFSYDVLFVNTGIGGVPLEVRSQVYFTVPTPAATDYVEITNQWSSNPSINGELKIGSGVSVSSQDGYGVDILSQQYVASPDWELVAHSNI